MVIQSSGSWGWIPEEEFIAGTLHLLAPLGGQQISLAELRQIDQLSSPEPAGTVINRPGRPSRRQRQVVRENGQLAPKRKDYSNPKRHLLLYRGPVRGQGARVWRYARVCLAVARKWLPALGEMRVGRASE